MKTRTFTLLTLTAFAITMLAFAVSSCSTREKGKNIGLQLYSIRDSIRRDVPAAIEKVAKMGYKFVEPAGYGRGQFYNLSPEEFKALCEKNKIYVLSSHTGRPAPDSANWEATMAWWDTCIAAHVAVGAKYIVQPSMGRDAYESLDGIKRYC
ncbi:MAG: sugar phosphate isomerase/epimerase, partial [Bacteroidales bacterium]|nr:sugar phosphate isomerase/epimerase [Bacteroidales bacterium]